MYPLRVLRGFSVVSVFQKSRTRYNLLRLNRE
ncbi:hypothetical protein J2T60_001480 [Natronospira proteinivora]|uniref:Uncharacterized protein n=1 Tax=Natronospira proteinivora TaxID=1807133 RepID=A0ABT1G9A2_9GAMM|nr:hypothetical protein [Natronospira proteinivora]